MPSFSLSTDSSIFLLTSVFDKIDCLEMLLLSILNVTNTRWQRSVPAAYFNLNCIGEYTNADYVTECLFQLRDWVGPRPFTYDQQSTVIVSSSLAIFPLFVTLPSSCRMPIMTDVTEFSREGRMTSIDDAALGTFRSISSLRGQAMSEGPCRPYRCYCELS